MCADRGARVHHALPVAAHRDLAFISVEDAAFFGAQRLHGAFFNVERREAIGDQVCGEREVSEQPVQRGRRVLRGGGDEPRAVFAKVADERLVART